MSKSNAKSELRAACKAAGIVGYSKMTVAEQRAALAAAPNGDSPKADAAIAAVESEGLHVFGFEIHGLIECPHCNVHLSNGVGYGEATEFSCLGCGEDFGPAKVAAADRHTGTGLKIEKDRPERNGIKRPSIGGKCRAIWDFLDTMNGPTAKMVRAAAEAQGWNPNNAVIEFYQWRKFNAA
jgi:hypothetical protein